jgi:hypothetical protein
VAGAGASLQAGATSDTLGELARTIRQEVDGLEEAMRLARIVTRLQVGGRLSDHGDVSPHRIKPTLNLVSYYCRTLFLLFGPIRSLSDTAPFLLLNNGH